MAQCVKCGKPVGCGCQLVNGVCDKCRQAEAEKIKAESEKKKVN